MPISAEAQAIIDEEIRILDRVLESLHGQFAQGEIRLQIESARARDLTSEIVTTRRLVDKQMLASDEAVSHRLRDMKREEIKDLDRLLDRPYFARIALEEIDLVTGDTRALEYKLGLTSNLDCRIIDWRNAPIAKLYYDYKEGDEYSELVQGKERHGFIRTRNKLEIKRGKLERISCRLGEFVFRDGQWQEISSGARSEHTRGRLPDVLSLISQDQYRTITEDATTAILIQGIAGSGKTTVALYRLAWMLHKDNSPLEAHEVLLLVLSPVLRSYIEASLEILGISGIRVLTYDRWCEEVTRHIFLKQPPTILSDESLSLVRLKNSVAVLTALEDYVADQNVASDYYEDLLNIFKYPERILRHDKTGLLDRELIDRAYKQFLENKTSNVISRSDLTLVIRLFQLKSNQPLPNGMAIGKYKHILLDEVQDFSAVQLSTVLSTVDKIENVTLAGDTGQEITDHQSFSGWEKLREHWGMDKSSQYISLEVSYRSTLPIMRLADFVSGKQRTPGRQGRTERPGRPPLWYKCHTEDSGITEVLDWLGRVTTKYPNDITAVLCRTPEHARYAASLLTPTFGNIVRLGDNLSFSFDEGILVTDVAQVKGLEFPHVLIWNPSEDTYAADSQNRNLLYVAITRAEEHLCLVTWDKPSPLLPTIRSSLVRGIEEEIEFESNEK